jgi:3-oxoacyl-[acyl-carrier-protein] synthase III
MAQLKFNNVGISGMAACVPRNVINNYEYTQHFPKEDVEKIVDKIGVYERRFVDENTCSSDLCFAAAEKLFSDMNIDRSEIDALLFISQTPDYKMPATSVILQDRLGLEKTTIAFDINLGCSAFMYGLTVAYSLLSQPAINKVLILNGETRSKVYSPKDRKTAFIFGDAGVAAIISKGEQFGESYFSLHSNGKHESLIKIKAGGYRNPSSEETLKEKVVDELGNIRSDEHGYMDGESVFNFVAIEVPKDIKRVAQFAGINLDEINYFVFHQANNFMNKYVAKKLKIDENKIPTTIAKFGNTSSVSIPLTIISELKNELLKDKVLCLSGFGVGMSWASAIIKLDNCYLSEIVEI